MLTTLKPVAQPGYGQDVNQALDSALHSIMFNGYKILNNELRIITQQNYKHYLINIDGIGWCCSDFDIKNDITMIHFIILNTTVWFRDTNYSKQFITQC